MNKCIKYWKWPASVNQFASNTSPAHLTNSHNLSVSAVKMQITTNLFAVALTLFGSTSSLALPAVIDLSSRNTVNKRVDPDTSTCQVVPNAVTNGGDNYDIFVGRPYNGGSGCADIKNALLERDDIDLHAFSCEDDGAGGTRLIFNAARGMNVYVDATMEGMYPTVDYFGC